MRYRTLGQTNLKLSTVGLGTWAIGGGVWWGQTDELEAIKTIHAALDHGINLIDTAPAYGFGQSEITVGKGIKDRRDKVILATKCGLWWDDHTGSFFFELDGKTVRRSLHPSTIIKEVENSLRRLQTDYIDLMQTHWQAVDPDKTPIAETMECLLQLKAQGKIRAIGVSNVTVDDLDEYQQRGVVDSCQPRYSMLDRAIETDLLPYCFKHSISTLVYSPLEQGLLTGKIGMDRQFAKGEYRSNLPWFKPENRAKVLKMLAGWHDVAAKYKCELAELVIAWTLCQPGVTSALCGARKVANVLENVGAGDIELSDADVKRLRKDVEALGKPA